MSHGPKPAVPPPAAPAIQQVNTPTAFETAQNDRFAKMNAFENAPGPHDITQAPGISDFEDIYGNADVMANEAKLGGNPGQALSGGGSGDYQAQLAELGKTTRWRDRARGLSDAYQGLRAQAMGAGSEAAQLQTARQNTYADDMLKQQEAYYNRPKPRPLWERIAGIAIGGLGAAGTAGGSAGIRGIFG